MSETADEEQRKVVAFADFPEDQCLTYKVVPLPGRLLSAETIGGTLSQLAKVIKSANWEYAKGSIFIAVAACRITEDGAFEADLVQLPVQRKAKSTPIITP